MALTAPSTAVAAFDKGRLAAGISASDTTITVSPIYKTVNGVRTKQGLDSTSGECIISQGDYQERISFEGTSVNSTTKVTSLTTCTRGLPVTNTTANFAGGTGRAWAKGAYITVIDSASYNQSSVFKNVANTYTAVQTYNAQVNVASPLVVSGTSSYVKLPELTTTQRDALTGAEGMLIKNSTTGTVQQYTGGAWASVGTDATANGSTTVAGKFEEATVAEQGSATATGGTGARLVPAVANLVKTSSGAGDENKIPVLNASGQLATGFVNTSSLLTAYPGMMTIWTTDTAPTGWLLCYGQAVSRSTYSALFAVVSTTYGVGDGSTTFNIPDMRGRFPLGQDDMGGSSANRVTDTDADTLGGADGDELKDISHTHTTAFAGAVITNPGGGGNYTGASNPVTSSSGGSSTQDIMPPFITLNYIIFANA